METILLTGLAALAGFAVLLCLWITKRQSRHDFKCKNCGAVFRPEWKQLLFAVHALEEHKLTCPHCGVRDFCKDIGKVSR